MRKEINKLNTSTERDFPKLKVVENQTNHVHIEVEIESHVQSIRSLIKKLNPADRQRYFNGLLDHILCKEIEYPQTKRQQKQISNVSDDFSQLSVDDLDLIRELSVKLQDLYVRTGDVMD
ncbi:MAG: hypothetical protein IPL24_03560 [Bacteroidetes bacterium]|nr:hypothetical protein [Bacteroidota bacterium]